MRRAVLAVVSTAAALVLLLSFKTHGNGSLIAPPAAISTPSGTSSTAAAPDTTTSPTASKQTTKTVTGSPADTRYGPVQVRIVVSNGKVTSAQAIDYPTGSPRDQEINAYAIPALNQEALQAGNANISIISGATFTSEGYIQSLQSALDQA